MEQILIDGSYGEGGGQILRSALALALLTGRPMQIDHIRRARPKPGLRPQHLKAVEAAARVGLGVLKGAELNSQSLYFEPHGIKPGRYRFDIGTAGSTSLLLQTLYLPLSFATSPSSLTLSGGTHVPWSPCYHYLELHWLPMLKRMGLSLKTHMESAGFYPKGGGLIQARIQPCVKLLPLQFVQRGALKHLKVLSAVANLDTAIAERQRDQAMKRLVRFTSLAETEILRLPARFQGTFLLLLARFKNSQCCFYGLGARGKRAEQVADEAADALEEFLAGDGAVDPYLADQLLLPLVFAEGRSELKASRVTQHLLTNRWLIQKFLPVAIEVEGTLGTAGLIKIEGMGRHILGERS